MSDVSALNYYAAGRTYIESYLALSSDVRIPASDRERFTLPEGALLGFGVETLLKAFLRHTGTSQQELKAHGLRHSLQDLYDKAVAAGLDRVQGVEALVQLLDKGHAKHWYRYMPENEQLTRFDPTTTNVVATHLHEQVRLALGFGPTPG